MEPFTNILNTTLALGTVVLAATTLGTIILMIVQPRHRILRALSRHAFVIGFLLSLSGMAFSLLYSEVIGFAPCILCIIQRWFLYPQVALFGWGAATKAPWSMAAAFTLSVLGGIVSLYHNYLDWGGSSLGICGEGDAVSCTQRFVYEFGFVTIPFMTLTVFAALIVLAINTYAQRNRKELH